MKKLYMRQKLLRLNEQFTIIDEQERPVYFVEGSFMKIPKQFTIYNANQREIGKITKQLFHLFPKFLVEVKGKKSFLIEKRFSMFFPRYEVVSSEMAVDGNLWEMDFTVTVRGRTVATIHKAWLSLADVYEITLHDEAWETDVVALVTAIDRVKAQQSQANSHA